MNAPAALRDLFSSPQTGGQEIAGIQRRMLMEWCPRLRDRLISINDRDGEIIEVQMRRENGE